MSNGKNAVLLFLCTLFFVYIPDSECRCDNLKASVSQKIIKQGFHREVNYVIKLYEINGHDIWSSGMCRLSLKQKLPPGAYVNIDELREIKRFKKVNACPVGDIDIEKPKHMSPTITVYIYSSINSSQITLNLPIHLRYHKAKLKGGYETVRIRQPWVLIRCPNNVFRMCNPATSIIAPCSECSSYDCSWHNITNEPLTSALEVSVPVGNIEDFTIVALVTFFMCFAGCFYIIIISSKRNKFDHQSKHNKVRQIKKNN